MTTPSIKKPYSCAILVIIAILIIILLVRVLVNKRHIELFANDNLITEVTPYITTSASSDVIPDVNLFNNPAYEKNRTLLYGSLFLDNLNKQIKNMTDPSIKYDNKRIEIIKYADALL